MYRTHFHIVVVMLGIDMLRKGDEIISKVSCPRICAVGPAFNIVVLEEKQQWAKQS